MPWVPEVSVGRSARLVGSVLCLLLLGVRVQAADRPADTGSGTSTVVLELFTSQGCAGCPPADRLLSRLGIGDRVISLAFHVDYWDDTGWRDPFAKSEWTERQETYADAFHARELYTPQMVINGRRQCVGSDEERVRRELAALHRTPPQAQVRVSVEPPSADGGHRHLRIHAERDRRIEDRTILVMVAVAESGLTTAVRRGENAGRKLTNDFVVRTLERAFTLAARSGLQADGEATLTFGPGWEPRNLRAAVFLQDAKTREIYGAAVQPLG